MGKNSNNAKNFRVLFALSYESMEDEMSVRNFWTMSRPTLYRYGLLQAFLVTDHEIRSYGIHKNETLWVSSKIWTDSMKRRISLLHVHTILARRQHQTDLIYCKPLS